MKIEAENIVEGQTAEFKLEYTKRIIESAIAFANTGGGTIYVGVSDNGDIVGLADADLEQRKISNSLSKAVSPDLALITSMTILEIESKNIIKVIIQKGHNKPYYLKKRGICTDGVWIRVGSTNVPASDDIILKMIKESSSDEFENLISINQELTFDSMKEHFFEADVKFEDKEKKALKLITKDGKFTNVGLVLSDQCPQTIRIAVYADESKSKFLDRKNIGGSILRQLDETFEFISRYNSLSAEIVGLKREERYDFPNIALREVLLNAIIHRDYSVKASTLISIYPDSIVFTTYGGLPTGVSLDDIYGGYSILRNENIAEVFYRLNYIEAFATGFPKVFDSYENSVDKPQISATGNTFKVILPNVNYSSTPFHEEKSEIEVPVSAKGQDMILKTLSEFQQGFSRTDVEQKLEISKPTALNLLANLSQKGQIQKIGVGKGTKYYLVDERFVH